MDGNAALLGIAWVLRGIGILLIARALTSWFPDLQRHEIVRLLYEITDPIIQPMRRLIPPVGMIDLSLMITVFALFFIANVIQGQI